MWEVYGYPGMAQNITYQANHKTSNCGLSEVRDPQCIAEEEAEYQMEPPDQLDSGLDLILLTLTLLCFL